MIVFAFDEIKNEIMFCDESITIICMIVFSFINCKPAAIDEIQSPTHEKFHTFLFSFTFLNFFEHRMLVGF